MFDFETTPYMPADPDFLLFEVEHCDEMRAVTEFFSSIGRPGEDAAALEFVRNIYIEDFDGYNSFVLMHRDESVVICRIFPILEGDTARAKVVLTSSINFDCEPLQAISRGVPGCHQKEFSRILSSAICAYIAVSAITTFSVRHALCD